MRSAADGKRKSGSCQCHAQSNLKSRHLSKKGQSIPDKFYGFDGEGDPDRYLLDYAFRDDAYRLVVLHLPLSIEELLKAHLYRTIRSISGNRIFSRNIEFVQALRFKETIDGRQSWV
jgi:hypothetical protein